MAKIETFTANPDLPPDEAIQFTNIGASVGLNGVNQKDDVMVIQALLKCALNSKKSDCLERKLWKAIFY